MQGIMSFASTMAIPVIIAMVAVYGLVKKIDVYEALVAGAADGLKVIAKIAPTLVGLLTAVYMLRSSGLIDFFSGFMKPALDLFGIPVECAPLMLLRPFSGSGAMAVGLDIIKTAGADTMTGRIASVMLGSSETTFYAIAVYFGACGIKRTRYALPAALLADFAGFAASAFAVRLLFR